MNDDENICPTPSSASVSTSASRAASPRSEGGGGGENDTTDDSRQNRERHREVEQKRRAKLSEYIREISSQLSGGGGGGAQQQLSGINSGGRLNQVDVLRLATAEIGTRVATADTDAHNNVTFLGKHELKQLILQLTTAGGALHTGFLILAHCLTGQIFESTNPNIILSPTNLPSLFQLVHPDDYQKVALAIRPAGSNVETGRCNFICRLRIGCQGGQSAASYFSQEYVTVHISGFLKSPPFQANQTANQTTAQESDYYLVAFVRPLVIKSATPTGAETEFFTRHDSTGRITFVDERVSSILGYAPSEMVGRRLGEFCASDTEAASVEEEIARVSASMQPASSAAEMSFLARPRDNTMCGEPRPLVSSVYAFCNPATRAFEYTICQHKLLLLLPHHDNTSFYPPPAQQQH